MKELSNLVSTFVEIICSLKYNKMFVSRKEKKNIIKKGSLPINTYQLEAIILQDVTNRTKFKITNSKMSYTKIIRSI